jgi:hypothetical protein
MTYFMISGYWILIMTTTGLLLFVWLRWRHVKAGWRAYRESRRAEKAAKQPLLPAN